MVSTTRVAEKDDSEARDIIFQTGHLMSRNLVKKKFHSKDFKMLLTWIAQTDERKAVNKRPVIVFCKLVIFWVRMGFGVNLKKIAPKCRSNDQQQKSS